MRFIMTFRNLRPEADCAEQRGVSIRFVQRERAQRTGAPIVKVNYPLLGGICDTAHWAERCAILMSAGQGVLQ